MRRVWHPLKQNWLLSSNIIMYRCAPKQMIAASRRSTHRCGMCQSCEAARDRTRERGTKSISMRIYSGYFHRRKPHHTAVLLYPPSESMRERFEAHLLLPFSSPPVHRHRRAQDYNNLCQCESLEDVKLNLQETDYDQFLSQENKVTPAALQDRATKKLVSTGRVCLAVPVVRRQCERWWILCFSEEHHRACQFSIVVSASQSHFLLHSSAELDALGRLAANEQACDT